MGVGREEEYCNFQLEMWSSQGQVQTCCKGNFQKSARMIQIRLLEKGDTQPELASSWDIIRKLTNSTSLVL